MLLPVGFSAHVRLSSGATYTEGVSTGALEQCMAIKLSGVVCGVLCATETLVYRRDKLSLESSGLVFALC